MGKTKRHALCIPLQTDPRSTGEHPSCWFISNQKQGGRQAGGYTPSLPLLAQAGKDSKVFFVLIVTAMMIPSQRPHKVAIPECWTLKRFVMETSTQEVSWEGCWPEGFHSLY